MAAETNPAPYDPSRAEAEIDAAAAVLKRQVAEKALTDRIRAAAPAPTPTPTTGSDWAMKALMIYLAVLLGVQTWATVHNQLPAPAPAPAPSPAPAPAPAPPPPPVPSVDPVPASTKLYVIQVYSRGGSDPAALAAVDVRTDPSVETALKAENADWHAWEREAKEVESTGLSAFLPDPARASVVLFVYDAAKNFYGADGKKLDRSKPVYLTPPATVAGTVALVKKIRGQ